MSETLKSIRMPASQSAPNDPAIVLLHGLGSNEMDLMGLAPSLDPRLEVVCLRAPFEATYGGYAWFDIGWTQAGVFIDEDQVLESRARLEHWLDDHMQGRRVFLGGFSQGAMMSLGVALRDPQRLSAVVLMSGRVLPVLVPTHAPEGIESLPFLVQHGLQDPLLPVTDGRGVERLLNDYKVPLTYLEYPMAHEVSNASLSDAQRWVEHQLNRAETNA